MERLLTVYEVLFDGPEDGPTGPAGDGTFIQRFREAREAEEFAAGATCYGRPATVKTARVPRRLAQRWGVA